MNRLRSKLRSKRGASITFALLIFLVCAVVSSVVIVAATTAGGRMSGAKETDQRYYAVTAAADALRETLVDGAATVVTYTADESGEPKADTVVASTSGICARASESLFSKEALPTLTIPTRTVEGVDYTCTITPTLEGGVLSFDITCSGGQINKTGAYTLQASFASDVKDSVTDAATGGHRAKVTWKFLGLRKIRAGGATP